MQLKLIADHFGRQIFSADLANGAAFAAPFGAEEYPCLIWTHASRLSPETRMQFAQDLVRGACRYAMCAGVEAEVLHDDIDDAYIRPFLTETSPHDHPLMMTTWHDGESMAEVAEFLVRHTNFGNHRFRKLLVVHIGGAAGQHHALEHHVAHESSRIGAV